VAPSIDPADVTLTKIIYESALCTVWKGTYKGRKAAIKIFDPLALSYNAANFRKEITMLSLIKHPHACPFYGAHQPNPTELTSESDNLEKPFIVMPYYAHGSSLAQYIERQVNVMQQERAFGRRPVIDICTLVNLAMNAANCIQFLHSRYIIHRDIKPANFLMDDKFSLKVIDFGVSRVLEDASDSTYTYSGTEVYMAPEVYLMKYDHKADSYSFGLVLWAMVTGDTPYKKYVGGIHLAPAVASGEREEIPLFHPPLHPDLVKLIQRCWDGDPDKRPDFNQILQILYDMTCPVRKLPYTHLYDGLDNNEFLRFVNRIIAYLDENSRTAFLLTNKKFSGVLSKF